MEKNKREEEYLILLFILPLHT